MKQVEQNYRSGELRVIDAPAPMYDRNSALVASAVSLISAGTEKQIVDLARSSLAGKAIARPDLVRQTLRKARAEGVVAVARKVLAKLDTPIPLGYSLAGTVVGAGPDAGVAPGDRVACAGAAVANHAEFNQVPRNLMVRIPDGVSDEDASFVTVGAIALQGVRVANPTLGERIVVVGLGLIGLLTVQLLKANGCRVLGFDPNPARVALALELGANAAVCENLPAAVLGFTSGVGADAVIITASTKSSEPLNQAAELSRMKGRIVVVGMVGMAIDREPFYKRELELRLSMSYGPGRYDPEYEREGRDYPLPFVRWTEQRNMQAFLELIAEGAVTPSRLVTHRFPIDRAEDAYGLMDGSEPYLAILLSYPRDGKPSHCVEVPRARPSPVGPGVAFIGLGNYAKGVLLPAFKKAGGQGLRTAVTASGISAYGAAESFGFERAATDPQEVFEDPKIATVFIATRHNSHAELATRALAAGKNTFVEKPLALNRDELRRVLQEAEASTGLLTVGFNRRFSPMIGEAKDALAGRTGPLNMTYRINAGFIPPDNWLHGPEGGGRIIGEVCHFVDTLSALAGAPVSLVCAVAPRGVNDSIASVLQFADGSVGTILYSSLGDPAVPKERIEVLAAGTVIEIDDFRSLSITRNGRTNRKRAAQDKGQEAMLRSFLSAIAAGGPQPIPLSELAATTEATFDMVGEAA